MSSPGAVLPLMLGNQILAVSALAVIEIVGTIAWVAIPSAPQSVPGALAWRGRALGLLDLGPALGLEPARPPTTRARNVILRAAADIVALSVDRVLELRTPTAELDPPHAAAIELPCLGELVIQDRVVPVLDLDAWVNDLRRSA